MSTDTQTPTAIEPSRVLVLTEGEQWMLHDALVEAAAICMDSGLAAHARVLANRIAEGDEYVDEVDEIAKVTLRKRRLETEIKRCNMRIEQLTDPVIEKLADLPGGGAKYLPLPFARVARDDKCYLKYADPTWNDDDRAYARMRAGEAMRRLPEFEGFIHETYNAQSVGAFIAERYKAALAEQLDKPEHERVPVEPDSVIPDELREWLSLSVKPRVKVTAT